MHYVSRGKGRPGYGTQSLENREQQAHLLLCNIAVLGECHYSAKLHPVLTWLCDSRYVVKLLSNFREGVKSFASKGQCCQVPIHHLLVPVPQPEQVFFQMLAEVSAI